MTYHKIHKKYRMHGNTTLQKYARVLHISVMSCYHAYDFLCILWSKAVCTCRVCFRANYMDCLPGGYCAAL